MLVSLVAVYNYDNSILDDLEIPEGMDANVLKKRLLFETAELTLLYSQPDVLKEMIENWSESRVEIWQKLWDLGQEEYDPLVNYDRTETESLVHGKTIGTVYQNNGSAGGTTQNDVYGFDSGDPVGKDKTTVNNHRNDNGTNTETTSGTDSTTRTSKGNIGVTTYQQMMKEEFEMRPKLNMYKYIVEEFKHEFCVLVY